MAAAAVSGGGVTGMYKEEAVQRVHWHEDPDGRRLTHRKHEGAASPDGEKDEGGR